MPIHDWTRVNAGTWHAFHLGWIAEMQISLNDGRMPQDVTLQASEVAGSIVAINCQFWTLLATFFKIEQ